MIVRHVEYFLEVKYILMLLRLYFYCVYLPVVLHCGIS